MNIDSTNYQSIPDLINLPAENRVHEKNVGLTFAAILDWGGNGASNDILSNDFFAEQEIEWYLFSDTIERNIVTGDDDINYEWLNESILIANLKPFIDELPLGLNTKIGAAGNGISGGQKQRILMARAIYKNPYFILFDDIASHGMIYFTIKNAVETTG